MYLIGTVQYASARTIGQGVPSNCHLYPATIHMKILFVYTVDAIWKGMIGTAVATMGGTDRIV